MSARNVRRSETHRTLDVGRNAGAVVATAGVVAVLLVASVLAPDRMPLGVILLGALIGTGSGLLAVGLVLTYRSHRIINFALGGIGGLGAGLAVGLHLGQGWPWPVAIALGVVTGLLAGALIERVVLRRLDKSPRLVVTVATIGLAQLCAAGQAALPTLLDGPAVIGSFRTPLSDVHSRRRPAADLRQRPGTGHRRSVRARRADLVPAAHRRRHRDPRHRGER